MPKVKIDILESTCVPLPFENVDTDQIIPARFLSATSRQGFGDNLFRDWRYTKTGEKNSDFILNNPVYNGKVSSLQGRISVVVPVVNMLSGLYLIMASGLWFRVFSPISS